MAATTFCRSVSLAVAGVAVATVSILVPAQPAAAAFSTGTGGRVNGHEASLLSYVNNARVARGIPALVAATGTTDLARAWSARMAGASSLNHNPGLAAQIGPAGSPHWRSVAENVGYASACSAQQLFDAYWASTGHRNNILNRSMRYVGIGTYERAATGWPCGRAWNTMVFVDSYTSAYGSSRNPPQGMVTDSRTITATEPLATFETGPDPRAVTAATGRGLTISRPVVPISANDDAMHWTVAQTAPLDGWGSLYLRDAVDLRSTGQVRITIQVVSPTRRGLPVTLTVSRDWGASATIGTMVADSVPRSYTFAVPASVRGFNNTFRLTVANRGLTALSSQTDQRSARISVYQVDLIV